MKNALLGLSLLFLISSCDIVYVEEVPIDSRNLFTGRYEVEEYSETYDQFTLYDMRILKDGDPYSNVVYLRNFYGANIEIYANVYGNELRIPRQQVNGYLIKGVGHMDYHDLVLSYRVEDLRSNSYIDFCSTVAYRR
ncbi:hypothetical protein ACV07N_14425 [Roseivirga echinicomitans]